MRRFLPLLFAAALPASCIPAQLLEQRAEAAYDQSDVVARRETHDGKTCTSYSYTETENAAASTASITLDYTHGTIRSIHQDKTAGTAATLHTVIGRTVSWVVDDANHIVTATATADPIYEQGATHFYAPAKTLYIRSGVNAGADNAISTEILVCAGWF